MTKQEYLDRAARLPAGLFGHYLQQQAARTLYPQSTTGDTGILGRILKAFEDQAVASGEAPIKGSSYSITSTRTIFRGSPSEPILLSSADGMLTYGGSQAAAHARNPTERSAMQTAIERLVSFQAGSIFASTHNSFVRNALFESDRWATWDPNGIWEMGDGRWDLGSGI